MCFVPSQVLGLATCQFYISGVESLSGQKAACVFLLKTLTFYSAAAKAHASTFLLRRRKPPEGSSVEAHHLPARAAVGSELCFFPSLGIKPLPEATLPVTGHHPSPALGRSPTSSKGVSSPLIPPSLPHPTSAALFFLFLFSVLEPLLRMACPYHSAAPATVRGPPGAGTEVEVRRQASLWVLLTHLPRKAASSLPTLACCCLPSCPLLSLLCCLFII